MDKTFNVSVGLFAYANDRPFLKLAIERLRKIPFVSAITVFDEDANPLEGDFVMALLKGGVGYTRTKWPRNRNLNGKEAIRGIHTALAGLATAPDKHGNLPTWVMKLDCDTLLSANFFLYLATVEADAFGFVSRADKMPWRRYGCTYAVRGSQYADFLAKVEHWLQSPLSDAEPAAPRWQEDVCFSLILEASEFPNVLRDLEDPKDRFCLYPWRFVAGEQIPKNAVAINFGCGRVYPKFKDVCDRDLRDLATLRMTEGHELLNRNGL